MRFMVVSSACPKSLGERHEPNLLVFQTVFPLFLLVKCAMYSFLQWFLVRSERYLCTKMFSPAVRARCQLLAHRPKVRATVVPAGKAPDVHHQLCAHASVLALGTERLWNGFQYLQVTSKLCVPVMLLEHERYYGLGMDALLVTVCSWSTNVIMVWAWML